MGKIQSPRLALRIIAAFSQYPDALEWGLQKATGQWGPIALASEPFRFEETDYYADEMGLGLKKVFWAFERPCDPGDLAAAKRLTNAREEEYAAQARLPEPRPLNLDPGYLNEAKLVLASTKDHAHRIYLADGIYAEVTLRFRGGRWEPWEWTFPDYRREDYQAFFTQCREYLRRVQRSGGD